jgi:hypothetical protein
MIELIPHDDDGVAARGESPRRGGDTLERDGSLAGDGPTVAQAA